MTVTSATDESLDWRYEDEIVYWSRVFAKWRAEGDKYLDSKLNPETHVDARIAGVFQKHFPDLPRVGVLDVGCGPLSVVGKRWGDKRVDVLGVDPLADVYKHILKKEGVQPPHLLLKGMGENADKVVAGRKFDYVHSRNALDHAEDAPLAVKSMAACVRKGGVFDLEIFVEEAIRAGYSGLHRWNFTPLADQVAIWNRHRITLLDDVIPDMPYRFTVADAGPPGVQVMFITMWNVDWDAIAPLPIGGNFARVQYDRVSNFLRVTPGAEFDPDRTVFTHVQKNGVTVASNYNWPAGAKSIVIRLPDQPLERVAMGQYHMTFKGHDPVFHNQWYEVAPINN